MEEVTEEAEEAEASEMTEVQAGKATNRFESNRRSVGGGFKGSRDVEDSRGPRRGGFGG